MLRSRPGIFRILALASLTLATVSLTACPFPGATSGPGSPAGGTPGASGSLDKSFGQDGIVTTDFADENSDVAYGVALQENGRIVAAGVSTDGGTGLFALVRYMPNGDPDTGFGTEGRVFTARGMTTQGKDVAVTADGKIVTGGWFQSFSSAMDLMLSRHLPDGQLDESFGDGGHAIAGYGSAIGNKLALQSDGKILLTGYNGMLEYKPVLLRYTADGKPDSSFGTDGKVQLDWGTDEDKAYAIAEAGGKIVIAGSAKADGFALSRLNADGSLDTGFGTGGTVKVETGENVAQGLAVASDGRIVVAGDARVMRFNADGGIDSSFGTGGAVELAEQSLHAVVLQPDGKLLLAGGQAGKVSLVRLKADGKLDETFADQGVARVAAPDAASEAYDLVLQPDGRIVLAGKAYQSEGGHDDFLVMRFWP